MATKSVAKALNILEVICTAGGPLDLHQISDQLDLPSSTAYRLLQTLMDHGFARQERVSRQYSAGLKIFELSQSVIASLQFTDVAQQPLRDLARTAQETIHLAVLDHYEVVYLQKFDSSPPVALYSRIGRRAPAYCTGVGKLLLAHLPQSERTAYFQSVDLVPFTQKTITEPAVLRAELNRIKELGYSIDGMEHEDGINCIACPVKAHTGEVIAAVSITAPVFRLDLDGLLGHLPLLQEKVAAISRELGYVEPRTTAHGDKAPKGSAAEISLQPQFRHT
jgi:DNA-binding IclR family transcriptional regulator